MKDKSRKYLINIRHNNGPTSFLGWFVKNLFDVCPQKHLAENQAWSGRLCFFLSGNWSVWILSCWASFWSILGGILGIWGIWAGTLGGNRFLANKLASNVEPGAGVADAHLEESDENRDEDEVEDEGGDEDEWSRYSPLAAR